MGIYVHGLYLEGASWSKKEAHLIEAARGELIKLIPCMFITGKREREREREREEEEEEEEEEGSEGARGIGLFDNPKTPQQKF